MVKATGLGNLLMKPYGKVILSLLVPMRKKQTNNSYVDLSATKQCKSFEYNSHMIPGIPRYLQKTSLLKHPCTAFFSYVLRLQYSLRGRMSRYGLKNILHLF